MTKEEFAKSTAFKILLPLFIVASALLLWMEGYAFGQWLYDLLH